MLKQRTLCNKVSPPNQFQRMTLLEALTCEYHSPPHSFRLSSVVCPSVFFPGATNREPARRDVTKRRATGTKTNHRPDIYFLLFRGNRATCFSFSNQSPLADDGFLFSGIAFPSRNPHAPFRPRITRVNPLLCHVPINDARLEQHCSEIRYKFSLISLSLSLVTTQS